MFIFIFVFGFFLIMVLVMVVGYFFQKKLIFGSCGGLGVLGIEKVCDCLELCDCKKLCMEKEEVCQKKLNEWKQN